MGRWLKLNAVQSQHDDKTKEKGPYPKMVMTITTHLRNRLFRDDVNHASRGKS